GIRLRAAGARCPAGPFFRAWRSRQRPTVYLEAKEPGHGRVDSSTAGTGHADSGPPDRSQAEIAHFLDLAGADRGGAGRPVAGGVSNHAALERRLYVSR